MFCRYELNCRKDVPSFMKLFSRLTRSVFLSPEHFTVQHVPHSGVVLWLSHTVLVKAQGHGVTPVESYSSNPELA